MKTKKLLSLLLCFVMLFGTITLPAYAEDATTTVYVTLSRYGEILTDANGEFLACVPVTLGEESPNLDTVLRQFHAMYHENGEDAYSSYEGEYGTAIKMLWEDESELFGYQVNGGTESVYGLSHTVNNGDYVDVCIYENKYPETESYTKFDVYTKNEEVGEEIHLTLYEAGYDENWNTVFSPCPDTEITINGESSGYTTDENGNVTFTLDDAGKYIVSAKKEKVISDSPVAAICAPVCIVEVKEDKTEEVLFNIALKYSSDEAMKDGNAYWFAADIADYKKTHPEADIGLSEETKQLIADNIIDMCCESDKPGDLAKGIIALRSMGYDAKNAYKENGELIDIAQKLSAMVEETREDVTNIYTLPYVLIALEQGEDYADPSLIEWLVDYVTDNKEKWFNMEFGTDALTPMLLAISPYAETSEEVDVLIAESVSVLKEQINSEGLIGNAPSTALAIVALCAVGINPEEMETDGVNLIDGLMSQLNENCDGFLPTENSFATEQGFRAINALKLMESGDRVYNFRDFPIEEIYHSTIPCATVIFDTDPKSAEVKVNGKKSEDNIFLLEAGTYSYKVTRSGYSSEEGEFTVSEEEAMEGETITIEVELNKKSSGGGGRSGGSVSIKEDKTTEDTKTEDVQSENTAKTFPDITSSPYKTAIEALYSEGYVSGNDKGLFMPDNNVTRAEFTVIIARALNLGNSDVSPFDDTQKNDWFYEYVNAAYKKGIVSGTSATTFNPYGIITKEEAAAMILRVSSVCNVNTSLTDEEILNTLCQFADYKEISPWATSAMAYCYENGIFDISELNSTPKKIISRAEMAHMIYSVLKKVGNI